VIKIYVIQSYYNLS